MITWSKYLLKPVLLAQNPNLNYLAEPRFQGVNRIFALEFEVHLRKEQAIKKYYLPNVEMKDYNVMTDGKTFLISQ